MTVLVKAHHRRLAHRPDPREAASLAGLVDLGGTHLPVGPPQSVVMAVRMAVDELNLAPEIGSGALRGRLARYLRVDRDRLVINAGADALLRDLLIVICDPDLPGGACGNEIVFTDPASDNYVGLIEAACATPIPVPLVRGRQDVNRMVAAINRDRCRAVLVSNPHIPTGDLISGEELEDFLDRVPAHVSVVLDETHRDFAVDLNVAMDVPDGLHLDDGHPDREGNRPNVVVLRTWDTAYGLGALRIGYLAADPVIAAVVAKTMAPFGVNRVAQAAAAATLDSAVQEQYRAMWAAVARARSRMRTELHRLGFDVPESYANFLWLRLGQSADEFARHCARQQIRVRAYPQQGVRVSVGLPEHNEAFLEVVGSYPGLADRDPGYDRGHGDRGGHALTPTAIPIAGVRA